MKSSPTENSAIARSAARLRIAIFAVMALMVILYGAARFGVQLGGARVEARVHGQDPSTARLMADITLVLLVVAFFQLTRMLGRLASGEMFTAQVIGHFRGFALWLLLTALFGLAGPLVASLLSNGAANHFQFVLDFQKLLLVAVTLVLFLLARLLERARRLEEENREFV
jgi:hypothetical protein